MRRMTDRSPLSAKALDEGLDGARERTRELTELELTWSGKEPLSKSEINLLRYGVGRGWITCLEYLRDHGVITLE